MINKLIVIVSLVLLVFSSTGYAQGGSFSFKVSTLGGGVEAEKTFTDSTGGRVGVNYFTGDYSATIDNIDYDMELNLMTVSAILNWHPFKGGFRISGGAMYNDNHIDITAEPSISYKIGDTTYTASDVGTLEGKVKFNEIVPYIGIGWDTSFGKRNRFGLLVDLGVIYQGSPDVELTATGLASSQAFENDIQAEEDKLQEDLDEYEYYPVIGVGLSYRF
jgi:hypothetical protein